MCCVYGSPVSAFCRILGQYFVVYHSPALRWRRGRGRETVGQEGKREMKRELVMRMMVMMMAATVVVVVVMVVMVVMRMMKEDD